MRGGGLLWWRCRDVQAWQRPAPGGLVRLRPDLLDAWARQMLSGPNVELPGEEKDSSRAFVVASNELRLLDHQLPGFMSLGFSFSS